MKSLSLLFSLLLVFFVACSLAQVLPSGSKLLVLLNHNVLLVTPGDAPYTGSVYQLSSIPGIIRGIDVRPANGVLYAITNFGQFWSIDYNTGAQTLVSNQTVKFNGGQDFGFDFNPTVDRARCIGRNTKNARYNVDTGALSDFDPVAPGIQFDLNENYPAAPSTVPQVVGAAYTNSYTGPPLTTKLYVVDIANFNLALQNPPNNGTLTTVGSLGITGFKKAGFDIYTNKATNATTAILGTNKKNFYTVDLTTGAATRVWADSAILRLGRPIGLAIVAPAGN
jgi:hypothetical protein